MSPQDGYCTGCEPAFGFKAEVSALERNSLSAGMFAAQSAYRGQAGRRGANTSLLQSSISVVPIMMTVGVLTTEPADEITINKVEAQQGGCIKKTMGGTESVGFVRRWVGFAKFRNWCQDSDSTNLCIEVPENGGISTGSSVTWLEELPNEMDQLIHGRRVCNDAMVEHGDPKTPAPMTNGFPRTIETKRTKLPAMTKGLGQIANGMALTRSEKALHPWEHVQETWLWSLMFDATRPSTAIQQGQSWLVGERRQHLLMGKKKERWSIFDRAMRGQGRKQGRRRRRGNKDGRERIVYVNNSMQQRTQLQLQRSPGLAGRELFEFFTGQEMLRHLFVL